jgi:iron complex outermembrane recepter protein
VFDYGSRPLRIALSTVLLLWVAAARARADDATAPPQPEVRKIEEVVVTARRREETAQQTPLSMQVLTPADVEQAGITQSGALNAAVPGMQVGTQGGISQIFIRGIGDYSANGFAQTGVAFNVDGVYVARAEGTSTDFYDLERIEVLKGPQGTLYGRNTTGGAINLVTRRPQFEREAYVIGELGSHSLRRFEGALNQPLTDTVAVRGAIQVVDRDGYLSDGYDDQESQSGRLRLLWQPSASASLLLNAGLAHLGGKGGGGAVLPRQGDPWLGPSSPQVNAFLDRQSVFGVPGAGVFLADLKDDGFVDSDFRNLGAELDWDLGPVALTLLPAFRSVDSHYRTYGYGYFAEQGDRSSETTVEARLSHDGEWLRWVGGMYSFFEDEKLRIEVNLGDPFIDHLRITVPTLDNQSWATFAEATLLLHPRLRLIAGLRYTNDHRSTDGFFDYLTTAPILPQRDFAFSGKISNDAVTWKTGLEYDLAPRSLLFFTVATGFKSGGFFQARATPQFPNTFKPETLLAYELGSRNRFFDDRLQLNLGAFYWNYHDQQVSHLGVDADGNLNFVTDNAGQATLYGGTADLVSAFTRADTFRLGVEYVHSEYDRFIYKQPSGFARQGLSTGCRVTTSGLPLPVPGLGTDTIDCSGFELPHAAKWAGSTGYEHTIDLGGMGTIVASADAQFASARWLTVDFVSNGRDGAYVRGNAALTYHSASDRWSVGAWVRNIGDAAVYTGGFPSLAPNVIFATIEPPRTFGGRVSVRF